MGVVNLWNQRKSLEIINGVIHRNFESAEGLVLYKQILVPGSLRTKFLYWVHGDPTSGHFGVQKTSDKLQRYAYWSGWRKDAELFVPTLQPMLPVPEGSDSTSGCDEKRCVNCFISKVPHRIDRSTSSKFGWSCVLAYWNLLFYKIFNSSSIKRQICLDCSQRTTQTCLFNLWCGRTSGARKWSRICEFNLVPSFKNDGNPRPAKHSISPGSKFSYRENTSNYQRGLCKNNKKNIREIGTNKPSMFVLRTTRRNIPQQLLVRFTWCSCENHVLVSICFWTGRNLGSKILMSMQKRFVKRMQKAYQIVSDQLKVTFDRAKRRYDQRVHAVHFPLNSYVWFFCPRLTAGRGRKFRKLTDGPFRIVRILNDVNYVIQKVPGGRLQICHVDRLLRYEGEPPQVWIRYDRENARVPPVPTITENQPETIQNRPMSPRLVGNPNPSTSPSQQKPHRKTRRCNRRANSTKPKQRRDKMRFKGPRNLKKSRTVQQSDRGPDFNRNADNRPIT